MKSVTWAQHYGATARQSRKKESARTVLRAQFRWLGSTGKECTMRRTAMTGILTVLSGALVLPPAGSAQPPDQPGRGPGAATPAFVSPEVLSDRRVAFRIFSPKAEEVRLVG